MDRKSFIQSSGRIVFSCAAVFVVSFLAGKQKITITEHCDVQSSCKKCRLLHDCTQPRALKQLRNEKR